MLYLGQTDLEGIACLINDLNDALQATYLTVCTEQSSSVELHDDGELLGWLVIDGGKFVFQQKIT